MESMLLRGAITVKVDDKGRLKLPSPLKERLADRYRGERLFVTSLTGDKVFIYPLSEWEKIEERIAQVPQFDKLRNKFEDAIAYYGAEATVDDQGRMLLPAKLRDSAAMTGDVTLVWKLNRIEVRSAVRYVADVQGNPFTEEDMEGLSKWGV